MNIREATTDDLSDILRMGFAFHEASGYADICEPDTVSMLETAERLMADEKGLLLVAESDDQIVGMAGIVAYPIHFNRNYLATQEMFWWVDKEYRTDGAGRGLLLGIESWAQKMRARSNTMISLNDLDGERVGKLYKHAGYRPGEQMHIRRFEYGH